MAQTLAQRIRAKYPNTYTDLTDQQLEQRIDAKYPGIYADIPRSGVEGPGLLSSGWETAKNLGSAALEAIGRPAELVSGTVAGALSPERDLTRGLRAFTEPLVGSTQQEHFGKVIEEQAPEFAKAHPWITAGAGLAADVVLDPTNLLAGAGFIRKGLIKGAEAVGAGAGAAKVLMAPTKAWQSGVVPALEQAAYKVGQAVPIPFVKEQATLRAAGRGASGMTYPEILAIEKGKLQGELGAKFVRQADALKNIEALSTDERSVVSRMIAEPLTEASQAARLDPKLAAAEQAAKDIFHSQYLDDVATLDQRLAREAAAANMDPTAFRAAAKEQALQNVPDVQVQSYLAKNPSVSVDAAKNILAEQGLRQRYLPGGAPLLEDIQPLTFVGGTPQAISAGKKLLTAMRKLTDAEKTALGQLTDRFIDDKGVLDKAALAAADQISPNLRKILEDLDVRTSRTANGVTTRFANLKTLHFLPDSKGVLQPMVRTELPNYVFQASRGEGGLPLASAFKLSFAPGERRLRTFAEHAEAGGITDVADLIIRRQAASEVARSNTRILERTFQEFGEAAPKSGFRQLSESKIAQLPEPLQAFVKGKYVPTAVANDLEKVTARLHDPAAAEGIITQAQKVWKSLVTATNLPGHQLVNLSGNMLNMYAVGMSPAQVGKYYTKALRDWLGTAEQASPYLDEFKQLGLGGELAGEAAEFRQLVPRAKTPTAQALTEGRWNPLNPEAAYYRGPRALNQKFIEDPGKLAVYQWARESGKTPDEAALLVKKALFDYSDLTDVEKRYFRHVAPFYTWTRKNVPLQLATLAKTPGRLANQQRLLESATFMADLEDQQPSTNVPEYAQGPEFFRIPGTESVAAARFPVFDLNWLNADDILERAAFQLNPLYRVPVELQMGRRLGTGQPISATRLAQPSAFQKLTGLGTFETPSGLRTTSLSKYQTEQIPLPLGAIARTAANQPEGEEEPNMPALGEFGLRALGMSPIQITPEMQRRERRRTLTEAREQRRIERLKGQ